MSEPLNDCSMCGASPATGYASINDDRYCHGDWDESPTCYQKASSGIGGVAADVFLNAFRDLFEKQKGMTAQEVVERFRSEQ